MFLHDLKVACRSLLKYKLQTVISVVGLAVGLTCFVVCNRSLHHTFVYNRSLPYITETYFLSSQISNGGNIFEIGIDIQDKFPEIEKIVTFIEAGPYSYKNCVVEDQDGNTRWRKETFMYSDSSFFNFFDFELLQGNWNVVKEQADAVILTESAALRVFGTTDVVGKTFRDLQDFSSFEKEYKVLALVADFPKLTRFANISGLVLNTSEKSLKSDMYKDIWKIFFRISQNVDIEELNRKIDDYLKNRSDLLKGSTISPKLCPYFKPRVNPSSFIMLGIGLLVLITAIFNYVIFMSGRILNRQKEYGIRQIAGANTRSMFRMFTTEIALSMVLCVLVSLMFIELITTVLSSNIFDFLNLDDTKYWFGVLAKYLLGYATFVCGVMIGICWLILKRFRIQTILQHIQGGGVRYKNRLSNLLLGLQLTICILLGGGALFLYAQQDFLMKRFRGKLSIEECRRIYSFNLNGDKLEPIRADFQNMVNSNPYIESSCRSYRSLLRPGSFRSDKWKMEGVKNELSKKSSYNLDCFYIDGSYPEFIPITMEKGRFFRDDELNYAVVNRKFVQDFGIDPLGKDIIIENHTWEFIQTYHIIGIIEDIHPIGHDFELKLNPCIYLPYPEVDFGLNYHVKLVSGANPEVLAPLEAKMREQVNPFTSLWIESLEEDMERYISTIRDEGILMFGFASICIIICLLGIYSSMMLAVEKRGREMAIRKINGARLLDVANIFVRHYFVLLGVAALIAFPALYLGVQTWLENYTYRVSITPFPFIAIFVLLFAIVLLTIGSQLLKIMRVNPVEKLKSE